MSPERHSQCVTWALERLDKILKASSVYRRQNQHQHRVVPVSEVSNVHLPRRTRRRLAPRFEVFALGAFCDY
jgi:hypothetical protein